MQNRKYTLLKKALPGHKTQISKILSARSVLALKDDPESAQGKASVSEMSLSGKSIKHSLIHCRHFRFGNATTFTSPEDNSY